MYHRKRNLYEANNKIVYFSNYEDPNAEDNIRRWTKLQDEKRKFGWTPKKGKTKEEEEEEDNMNEDKKNENNEK